MDYSRIFDDGDLTGIIGDPPTCAAIIGGSKLQLTPPGAYGGLNVFFTTVPGKVYTYEFDLDYENTDITDNLNLVSYDHNLVTGVYSNIVYQPKPMASGHYAFNFTAGPSTTFVKLMYVSGANVPLHHFSVDNIVVTSAGAGPLTVIGYKPEILETHDYYPFGFDMPGRNVTPVDPYKYGHNGQERERSTFEGAYSADFWGYDSRLGRRWEQDPLAKDWQSPYSCFDNNPIAFSDPDGLEATGDHGPKKGDKYDCGDGTHEVFDGKEYKPEGVNGQPMYLPNSAKLEFAKQNFYGKNKILALKGQVIAYTIKGETFSAQYGGSAGRKGTQFFGYLNEDGETYQGDQNFGENVGNGTKHWYLGYSGQNTNSTQEAWKKWLTFYNYSQFLRGVGFDVIEGLPGIWRTIVNHGSFYSSTQLPKYFTIICNNGRKFFMTPNATKHILERISIPNLTTPNKNLITQLMLQSLHGSLNKILTKNKGVIQYGVKYVEDGWEIIFSAPRSAGELPAIKHALPLF